MRFQPWKSTARKARARIVPSKPSRPGLRPGRTSSVMRCATASPSARLVPILPEGPRRIDLALVDNLPTVLDVLRAVHAEFALDRVLITQEMTEVSPGRVQELRDLLGDTPLEVLPHVEFKHLAATARATIRTGDATPYANIILVSG